MSIEAIEAIEKYIAKRDGLEPGLSIKEIKEKIAEHVRTRRNDWDNAINASQYWMREKTFAIREGRTLEREKLNERV